MKWGRLVTSVAVVSAVFVALACSGHPSHPPLQDPAIDGGLYHYDAGLTDGREDTTGLCNDLQAPPKVYVEFMGPGGGPTPAGGAISDGLYVLQSYRIYANNLAGGTGVSGLWFRASIRFTGTAHDDLTETDSSGRVRLSGTWQVEPTSPTSLALAFACPENAGSQTVGYTAGPSSVTVFFPSVDGGPAVAVYTLAR